MYKLDRAFQFQTSDDRTLKSRVLGLDLVCRDHQAFTCKLRLKLTYMNYQRLQTEGLFGYEADLCTPLSNGDFDPQANVTVNLTLAPEHLELFADCTDAAAASAQLLMLPKTSPLHQTETWLLQSVEQGRGEHKTGYRTFWDYIDLRQWTPGNGMDRQLGEFLHNFVGESRLSQDLAATLDLPLPEARQTAQDLTKTMLRALPSLLRQEHQGTSEVSTAIAQLWQVNLQQQLQAAAPTLTADIDDPTGLASTLETLFALPAARPPQLLDRVAEVFDQEGWAYERVADQPWLRSLFESPAGQWLCLIEAQDAQQRLHFYSVGKGQVPLDRHQEVMQLFSTLNYSGSFLGSFELDCQDGEFRYRTGIDTRLLHNSAANLKTLLQDNAAVMEQYLPLLWG